mmetsp:Transcript_4513/g.11634  ORF Transcript_4513/g.11634 Transcript_4513/m.11634 type:complete len:602 (-) Transcript_4513:903-2708(-)
MIDSTSVPEQAAADDDDETRNGERASGTAIIVSAGGRDVGTTAEAASATGTPPKPKRKVRRVVRKKKKDGKQRGKEDAEVVDPVLLEKVMRDSCLPKAYTFEIVKTLKRINQILQEKHTAAATSRARQHPQTGDDDNNNNSSKNGVSVHIALQMPEGLLLYATVLSDVLERLVAATNKNITSQGNADRVLLRVSVLGDVTYGACCVDDLGAQALGCDLLVHYGHSCLVPIQHTVVPCLYVFVEITIDVPHLVECFHQTILGLLRRPQEDGTDRAVLAAKPHVYLMGTIQFRHALMEARRLLRAAPYEYDLTIPQAKPLSPGEVLGCTSPVLAEKPPSPTKPRKPRPAIEDACCGGTGNGDETMDCNPGPSSAAAAATDRESVVLFVADGRFHLESTMISNPHIFRFYRYDPYPKTLTEESYDHVKMKSIRYEAIEKARHKIRTKKLQQQQQQRNNGTSGSGTGAAVFGIILGTLGRQGNPALLTKIRQQVHHHGLRSFVVLASEITPSKLALFRKKVDAWVQIACPRLSVDWGHHLSGDASVPVLNPYELFATLQPGVWRSDRSYPMDYYSQEGGPWSNYGDDDNKNRRYRTPEPLVSAAV